jgi:hypothetical protein
MAIIYMLSVKMGIFKVPVNAWLCVNRKIMISSLLFSGLQKWFYYVNRKQRIFKTRIADLLRPCTKK